MVTASQLIKTFDVWKHKGYFLRVALWFWAAAFIFTIILNLLGIPSFYGWGVVRFTEDRPRLSGYIRLASASLVTLSYLGGAIWLILNRAGRGMPLLAAYALLGFTNAKSVFADTYIVHDATSPQFLEQPFFFLRVIAFSVFIIFPLLFPNGRFVPNWTRYFAIFWIGLMLLFGFFPSIPLNFMYYETFLSWSPYSYVFLLSCISVPIGTQIYRYLKVSNQLEREQVKWIVIGMIFNVSTWLG